MSVKIQINSELIQRLKRFAALFGHLRTGVFEALYRLSEIFEVHQENSQS